MSNTVDVVDATPAKVAFVARKYNNNDEVIAKEEAELEAMKAEQRGETVDPEPEEVEAEAVGAEEKSWKKRHGDLRRHMQTKENEWESKFDDLKSQLSKSTQAEIKLPKSDEDLDAWMNEYPDVAAIVKTIAMKVNNEQTQGIKDDIEAMNKRRVKATEATAEAELMDLHPDFGTIKDDDAFHDWVEVQPKWVQDALYTNADDAYSAGRAIDLYKADMGKKPAKKNTAAANVNTQSSRTTPDSDSGKGKILESYVNSQSADWYDKNSEAVMEAIRTGNFVYDMSGGAR